jgi:hypothetical protein
MNPRALALLVLPACVVTSSNVNVGQVPRAAMPFSTAAPTSGLVEVTAGASALPTVTKAKTTYYGSGAEIPQSQMRAEARIRVLENGFIGLIYEHGFGHKAVDPALPPVDHGNTSGFGLMIGGSIKLNPTEHFSIGWTATAMRWEVPYDQYSRVTLETNGHVTYIGQGTRSDSDTTRTLGLGLWPSYRAGQVRIFGGGYFTQRPTVHLFTSDSAYITESSIGASSEDVVDNDQVDLVLGAGVEYAVNRALSFTAIVNDEVIGNVMRTGPSIQLALSVRLGERRSAPPASGTQPPAQMGPPAPTGPPGASYP